MFVCENLKVILLALLAKWRNNEIETRELHEYAEELYEELGKIPEYPMSSVKAGVKVRRVAAEKCNT